MANNPKSKAPAAPPGDKSKAPDKAVMYTRGASGRVYGAQDSDGTAPPPAQPAPQAAQAPKPAAAKPTAPKPAAKKPAPAKKAATAKEHSRALAQTVVTSFVDRLTLEAGRKGGVLTVKDIENLNVEFEQKMDALQTVFEASF